MANQQSPVLVTNQVKHLANKPLQDVTMDDLSFIEQDFAVFGESTESYHGKRFTIPDVGPFSPDVPGTKFHFFDREFFGFLWNFLMVPNGCFAYIYGESGTGKTSGIEQFLARLNWSCKVFNASKRSERLDLEGGWVPSENGLEYFEGVLIDCMVNGKALIINEVSLMDAGELTGLNDIRPGAMYYLAQKRSSIYVHPNFRLVLTDNTNGNGSQGSAYQDTKKMNGAFLDRCRGFEKTYLTPDQEQQVLEHHLEEIFTGGQYMFAPEELESLRSNISALIPLLVQFANDTRKEAKNKKISFPLTPRSLIDVIYAMVNYRSSPQKLQRAIFESYAWRLRPTDEGHLKQLFKARLGVEFKQAAA